MYKSYIAMSCEPVYASLATNCLTVRCKAALPEKTTIDGVPIARYVASVPNPATTHLNSDPIIGPHGATPMDMNITASTGGKFAVEAAQPTRVVAKVKGTYTFFVGGSLGVGTTLIPGTETQQAAVILHLDGAPVAGYVPSIAKLSPISIDTQVAALPTQVYHLEMDVGQYVELVSELIESGPVLSPGAVNATLTIV